MGAAVCRIRCLWKSIAVMYHLSLVTHLHQGTQRLKQLPVTARGTILFPFAQSFAHQSFELPRVGVRVFPDELRERVRFGEQSFTPRFDPLELRYLRALRGFPCFEPHLNGLRIHLAHEFPYVLHLAPPGLEPADTLRVHDGVAQEFRQLERGEALAR